MKRTEKPSSPLDLLDLLQDLALHDHVERGRRLVEDDELGLERERHADDHALAHPAGQLVRVRAESTPLDADQLEEFAGPGQRLALRHASVGAHHVEELILDPHDGVEGVHRALEDHRDVAPAVAAKAVGAHCRDVLVLEQDAAARDSRRRSQDLHDRVRDRALAAAGLTGEAQDLPVPDLEVDTVDRTDGLLGDAIVDDQFPQLQDPRSARAGVRGPGPTRADRRGLHGADHASSASVARGRQRWRRSHDPAFSSRSARSRGLLTSSMPASTRTSPRTVKASAAPGKKNGHH